MPVPKRRTSVSKRGKRQSHDRLDSPNVTYCKQCGSASLPHHVCSECGDYQGRTIGKVKDE